MIALFMLDRFIGFKVALCNRRRCANVAVRTLRQGRKTWPAASREWLELRDGHVHDLCKQGRSVDELQSNSIIDRVGSFARNSAQF